MVAADVAPLEPVCSALADALPRLAAALGLPADATTRMRSRLADFEARAPGRSLAIDPGTLDVHVCSRALSIPEAVGALAGARARRDDTRLTRVLDVLGDAGGATGRLVERVGPGDAGHVELHVDAGRLGLAAWAVVESAFAALGLRRAWHRVLESAPRGPLLDACVGIGLHVDDAEPSRIEVRIRRRDVSADLLVAAARSVEHVDPQRAMRAFYRLTEGVPGRGGLLPTTSSCFDLDGTGEPTAMRLALPIRAWARHDADVCSRIDGLRTDGARLLRGVLSTVLARGLEQRAAAIGIEMEWRGTRERVAVELSPDDIEDDPGEPLAIDASPWSVHPLLLGLERGTLAPAHAWELLAELHAAVIEPSARRWAGLVARIDDDVARSVLAHELATELGDGDVERSVARRVRWWLDAAPPQVDTRPHWRLAARLDAIFADEHPWVGVGALLASRRFAADVTRGVALDLRRHGHVDISTEIDASIGPYPDALAGAIRHDVERRAIARGEQAVLSAVWTALDDLERAR